MCIEFVQILHDVHQHWVTISTIGAKRNEIFIYNSLGTSVRLQPFFIPRRSSHITLQFVDVQQQTGLWTLRYCFCNGQQPGNCLKRGAVFEWRQLTSEWQQKVRCHSGFVPAECIC